MKKCRIKNPLASRRSIVDPDGNFEKFLLSSGDAPPAADLLSSPDKTSSSVGPKPVILPPTIRPQHVYAPMPALGALSLGLKGKKKKGEDEDTDFSKLMNGASSTGFFFTSSLMKYFNKGIS